MMQTFEFKQLGLTKQLILTRGRQQGAGGGSKAFFWTCYMICLLNTLVEMSDSWIYKSKIQGRIYLYTDVI